MVGYRVGQGIGRGRNARGRYGPPEHGPMTEAELQAEVVAECDRLGLPVFYVRRSEAMSRRGWPDLVIIGRRRVVFRELKVNGGALTSEQASVGWKLRAARGDWKWWEPQHWHRGEIQAELAELAEPAKPPGY
jgi:hypothetical protein